MITKNTVYAYIKWLEFIYLLMLGYKMSRQLIISAVKVVNNVGSLNHCLELEQKIRTYGYDIHQLNIDSLGVDWNSPEGPDNFRSGCAPIEALAYACELIKQGKPAVLISGEDNIKTGYSRDERIEKMAVFGSVMDAYNELAQSFLNRHKVDENTFRKLTNDLFNNYIVSYKKTMGEKFSAELLPSENWFQPITSLFRGVDCANPLIDFKGRVLIVNESLAAQLGCAAQNMIMVDAVSLGQLDQDGPDQIHKIVKYEHLHDAYQSCCAKAQVNFKAELEQGNALLDVYTCYPVVPMAFLLASGLIGSLKELPNFLSKYGVTVTGGMNLARAAWNNPALNAIISMHHCLLNDDKQYGMVHGNGGLGYRQGVALLERYSN